MFRIFSTILITLMLSFAASPALACEGETSVCPYIYAGLFTVAAIFGVVCLELRMTAVKEEIRITDSS